MTPSNPTPAETSPTSWASSSNDHQITVAPPRNLVTYRTKAPEQQLLDDFGAVYKKLNYRAILLQLATQNPKWFLDTYIKTLRMLIRELPKDPAANIPNDELEKAIHEKLLDLIRPGKPAPDAITPKPRGSRKHPLSPPESPPDTPAQELDESPPGYDGDTGLTPDDEFGPPITDEEAASLAVTAAALESSTRKPSHMPTAAKILKAADRLTQGDAP